MNTRKQVLLMSALLLVSLIIVGIYGAWYPYREVDARDHFEEATATRGSILFARNCRICHGDVGEGGALGARLPTAPALDRADLQGFIDSTVTTSADINASATTVRVSNGGRFQGGQVILIDEERMEIKGINGNDLSVERAVGHTEASSHLSGAQIQLLDEDTLAQQSRLITNTITCGRVGTAMPPWAQSQGSSLSDEQIRQLMVLITTARWDLVKEEVDREDLRAAQLLTPVSDVTTSLQVSDVSVFTVGNAIRLGEERMRILAVPRVSPEERDKSGIISVERGILSTAPLEHSIEEEIYDFPITPPPSINQQSCGQFARPAAPAGDPELIEPFTGQTVTLIAQNIAFDQRTITVNSGGQVRLRLDNRDAGVEHNVAVYTSSTNLTPAATGSVGLTFPGVDEDDTVFTTPAAGSYFFRCDVHPTTMNGTFTVN
jgi:plastocyanin/mono/diheme cytochrome c family protein